MQLLCRCPCVSDVNLPCFLLPSKPWWALGMLGQIMSVALVLTSSVACTQNLHATALGYAAMLPCSVFFVSHISMIASELRAYIQFTGISLTGMREICTFYPGCPKCVCTKVQAFIAASHACLERQAMFFQICVWLGATVKDMRMGNQRRDPVTLNY